MRMGRPTGRPYSKIGDWATAIVLLGAINKERCVENLRSAPCSLLIARWASGTAVGQCDEFGDLAAGGVVVGPEVGPVVVVAGHARPAAGVARDNPLRSHRLDVAVEHVAHRHVGKGRAWRIRQGIATGQGDDLGELAARDVVIRAEVGPEVIIAGFARPAAGVAADQTVVDA